VNADATPTHPHRRRTRQTIAQERFLRRRRKLAAIVEHELDPLHPLKHGLGTWMRVPADNRAVVDEPLQEIAALLRDPAITISESTLRRILAFVTDRSSPVYGQYSIQAGFAAHSLVEEVCTRSGGGARRADSATVRRRVALDPG
jgi:hypothetical protein